ncbi:hypothetical protein DVG80_19565 [Rhodococcus erythropolis]|nr:hypothetical protein DVG80_19565 [Rhodococcus erythropolis]
MYQRTSVGLDVHALSVVACAIDDRTALAPLDESSSSFDSEWGITVCHRAGPFWSRTVVSQLPFLRRGPARLLQSRVNNVHTHNT